MANSDNWNYIANDSLLTFKKHPEFSGKCAKVMAPWAQHKAAVKSKQDAEDKARNEKEVQRDLATVDKGLATPDAKP